MTFSVDRIAAGRSKGRQQIYRFVYCSKLIPSQGELRNQRSSRVFHELNAVARFATWLLPLRNPSRLRNPSGGISPLADLNSDRTHPAKNLIKAPRSALLQFRRDLSLFSSRSLIDAEFRARWILNWTEYEIVQLLFVFHFSLHREFRLA